MIVTRTMQMIHTRGESARLHRTRPQYETRLEIRHDFVDKDYHKLEREREPARLVRIAVLLSPATVGSFLDATAAINGEREATVTLMSALVVLSETMSVALYGAEELMPSKEALDTLVRDKSTTDDRLITALVGPSALEARTRVVSAQTSVRGQISADASSNKGIPLLPVTTDVGLATTDALALRTLGPRTNPPTEYAVAGVLVLEGLIRGPLSVTIVLGLSVDIAPKTKNLVVTDTVINAVNNEQGVLCAPSIYAFGPTVYNNVFTEYVDKLVTIAKTRITVSVANRGDAPLHVKHVVLWAKTTRVVGTSSDPIPNALYPGTSLAQGFGTVLSVPIETFLAEPYLTSPVLEAKEDTLSASTEARQVAAGTATSFVITVQEANRLYFEGENNPETFVTRVTAQKGAAATIKFDNVVPWSSPSFSVSAPCLVYVCVQASDQTRPEISATIMLQIRQESV